MLAQDHTLKRENLAYVLPQKGMCFFSLFLFPVGCIVVVVAEALGP